MDSPPSLLLASPRSALPPTPLVTSALCSPLLPGQATGAPKEGEAPPPAPAAAAFCPPSYCAEWIFRDYTCRRAALVRALTSDEKAFSRKCKQGTLQNLHLYGNSDVSWEVRPQILGQPQSMMLGVKLVRGDMERIEWLRNIAMHCDAWLNRICSFLGANLEKRSRQRLSDRINSLPTVLETFIASDTYRRICSLEKMVAEQNEDLDDALRDQSIYTVESIFDNYSKRRGALIRALTEDEEEFFQKCDPGMQPLHLYGATDGSWEVKPPELQLPASEPGPAPGINLVRDMMERHEWLHFVAVHCDTWLMKSCVFAASSMPATERRQLSDMIIDLPMVQEILSNHVQEKRSSGPEANAVIEERSSGPDETNEVVEEEEQEVYFEEDEQRSSGSTEANEVLEEEEDDATNEDNNNCASCHSRYKANSFWIRCDECGKWYHGKCENITPSEAERKEHYECTDCYNEKIGY